MKKLTRSLVAAALAVSMVVPVFALSSSTTHKYDSGDYADADGGTYSYNCDTAASTSSASARMTYGKSSRSISCTITANVQTSSGNVQRTDGDVGNSSVYASVGAGTGKITSATGKYMIGSSTISVGTVS